MCKQRACAPNSRHARALQCPKTHNERTCGDLDNLGISQRHQTTSHTPLLVSHAPRTHCLGLGIAQHCRHPRRRQRQLRRRRCLLHCRFVCVFCLLAMCLAGWFVCQNTFLQKTSRCTTCVQKVCKHCVWSPVRLSTKRILEPEPLVVGF